VNGRRRELALVALFAALGAAFRLLLAARTPVPSEDGASYLWMAQRLAAGDASAALGEVFPPGLALLLAPLVACGLEPFAAAQWFGALCGALTALPVAAIAHRQAPGSAIAAAVLWASGSLLARNAVEVYSEPPFLLVMALGTVCGLRAQWWRLGLCSGAAFLLRPEGLLLAAAFVATHRRPALRAALPAAAAVLMLAAARALAGHGFDPLPLLAFHEQRHDLAGRGDLLANLAAVPSAWLEAFGPAGLLPLLLLLAPRARGAGPLVWQIALQIAVVCTFVVRRRFFLSCAVPVAALAAAACARLPARARAILLALLAAFGAVTAWTGTIDGDRIAERRLGEHLATALRPGDDLLADLPRVSFFAGRRPKPPRHFDAAQLVAMAAPAEVRFVVLSERSRRGTFADAARGLSPHYAELELPADLAALVRQRGIAVFARR
jgi:hypothetical protein